MSLRPALLALGLGVLSTPGQAFNLYPAQTVLGLDDACRSTAGASAQNPDISTSPDSAIDCLFTEAVKEEAYRASMRAALQAALKTGFSSYITEALTARNRNQTWVVSAEIVRAAQYKVNKGATVEIFLPLTVSLKFTNILTGEVLFTLTHTEIRPVSLLASDVDAPATADTVHAAYRELLLQSLQALVQEAGQRFQPTKVSTTAQKVWKGYIVLDKGLDAGIGPNDELAASDGSSVRVIHAEAAYAVAVPILGGDIRRDTVFEKIATSTAGAVRKPRALLADIKVPAGRAQELTGQLFSDGLGDAAFNLIPVNARFTQLSSAISKETELSQDHIAGLDSGKSTGGSFRPLPDFFLRLAVAEPLAYSIPSATGNVQHRVVEARVHGEMLDSSGRVLFAASAKDRIEENVPDGMGFDTEQRKDAATKNALLDLSRQFNQGVKFNRFSLKIDDVSDELLTVADASGLLQPGAAIKTFRRLSVDGAEVLVPLWEAQVESRKGESAVARLKLPISSSPDQILKPKSGDTVLLDSTSQGGASGLAFCRDNPNAPAGALDSGNLPEQVYFAIGARSGRPLYGGYASYAGQQPLLDAITRQTANAGFKTSVAPQFFYPQDTGCLYTHYQASVVEDSCASAPDSPTCDLKLNLTLVARQLDSQGNKIGSAGLAEEFPVARVSSPARAGILRDLMQQRADKLLTDILKKPLFQR